MESFDKMKEEILRKCVQLCSFYSKEYILSKIQANLNTTLSYIHNLYKREIITITDICNSLKIYTEYKDKVKVISELNNSEISCLLYFSDEIKINNTPNSEIDL